MSEYASSASLPQRKIPDEKIEEYRAVYVDLLGFVPPRIQARTDLLARLDPELLTMQEELRQHCMYPECFDTKTSQLMLFAILLTNLQDAAKLHALAAYRAGASFEELNAVVNLVFLFRGLSAANLGAEIVQGIARSTRESE
jgi:alkylhydroperoxidase/carboxymuconolactone decarboxylase family protein YurZ